MTAENDAAANWRQASRQWSVLGSPQRPSAEDVAAVERAIAACGDPDRALRAVVLGVTPELVGCRWPAGTRLLATDNSLAMIQMLWPPPGMPAGARAICADWLSMPVPTGGADIVVGDGSYAAIRLPEDGPAMTAEVRRMLKPGGLFAVRVYLRPDAAEAMADLDAALAAGTVGSVHALKWRIAAAIQPSLSAGVRLADIWTAWEALRPAAEHSRGRPGWRDEEIATLARYCDNTTRYYFPTAAEFRAIVGDRLEEIDCAVGTYELAERCRTFIFRRH